MLLSLYGAFSSYAYSVASKSNADYFMQNAQEFVPNYVSMKEDPATKSNASLVKMSSPVSLRSSGVTAVVNTVDLSECQIRCHNSYSSSTSTIVPRSSKLLGTNGSYDFIGPDGTQIYRFVITIPKNSLPQSGKYEMSYSYMSHVAYSYNNIWFHVYKTGTNAAQGGHTITNAVPDHMDNSGAFSRSPILIDFADVSYIVIVCDLQSPQQSIAGKFAMRFQISDSSGTTETIGYDPPDTSASAAQTAQNTSQLVSSQNETNGLLHDIIQHISDQLAAMWDQLYNLMAVPWIANDNQRTNNTIEAIEENSQNTQTTIEEQTQWHGNFIIEGLKGLFIPDDDYFESVRNDLSSWFEQHFGFLAQSIDFFIRILNVFITPQSSAVIRFPGISVPNRLTGETYVILEPRNVNLETEINRIGSLNWSNVFPSYNMVSGWSESFTFCTLCRMVSSVILSFALIQMFIDKLHKIEGM